MIRAIIIDDEEDARKVLRRHLKSVNEKIEIIAEAHNAQEAEKMITSENPDLLFLDIAMPGKSGFELLKSLPDYKGHVIFVTAFNEYAEKAFRYLALGYLVKPIDKSDFVKTVNHAIDIISSRQTSENYNHLLELLDNRNNTKSNLIVPTDKGVEIIKIKDILYLEADRNYTRVVTESVELLSSKNISKIMEFLPAQDFFQTHKSYVVNMHKVLRLTIENEAQMTNGKNILISRRRKNEFMDALNHL